MAESPRDKWPREWVAAMARAYTLASRGVPAPNPHVGCVIVREGAAVGAGYHAYAGGPHAEAVALAQAGAQAKGADVFVTLEPCAHQGKTPPCADALIAAGVGRVIIDALDPTPQRKGGAERLRQAGIEVAARQGDIYSNPARIWLHRQLTGRPYVTLKAAITLDGKIARHDGDSKWITSPEAREHARRLRGSHGAVLVGAGTIRADDPALTVRDEPILEPPMRLILDPLRTLTDNYQVFRDGKAATQRVVSETQAQPGDIALPMCANGLDLNVLMDKLAETNIPGLLVEGGGHTVTRFLEAGLGDELRLYVAPRTFPGGMTWTTAELQPKEWEPVQSGSPLGGADQVLVWRRRRS